MRIAVPDAAANARVFGVPLDSRGVQPVWIEIANASPDVAVYLPIVTDPDYFSPREASWRFHERLHPEADAARDALFAASRMPGRIAPGATASGYVFTHRETGLKFVTVGMLRGGDELRFRFTVPVAGPSSPSSASTSRSSGPPTPSATSTSRACAPRFRRCPAAAPTPTAAARPTRSTS